MEVTVHGPNLFDQRKGEFHVHSADCADNAKEVRNNGSVNPWIVDVASQEAVVAVIFEDIIAENDLSDDPTVSAWDYSGEVHFAPCVTKYLPVRNADLTNHTDESNHKEHNMSTTDSPAKPKAETPTVDAKAAKTISKPVAADQLRWPSKIRATGTTVGLLDNRKGEVNADDTENQWYTLCVDHSGLVGHKTARIASYFRSRPGDWCPTCKTGDTPKAAAVTAQAAAKAEADKAKAAKAKAAKAKADRAAAAKAKRAAKIAAVAE